MSSRLNHAGASTTDVITQEADESAVQPFLGDRAETVAPGVFATDQQDANEAAVNLLSHANGLESPALTGTGFSYRHDWGRRRGQWRLQLNLGGVNPRSRVFVAIGEGAAGGPDNGKFIGSARYTLHNVAPRAGGVDVWVNIEWGSDIPIYVDYLVVNP